MAGQHGTNRIAWNHQGAKATPVVTRSALGLGGGVSAGRDDEEAMDGREARIAFGGQVDQSSPLGN